MNELNLIIACTLALFVGVFALYYKNKISVPVQLGIAVICTVYLTVEIILREKPEGAFSIFLGIAWIIESIIQMRNPKQS